LVGTENGTTPMKNSMMFCKYLKTELSLDSEIPLWGLCPQRTESRDLYRYLSIHVHNGIFHKNQNKEATQALTDR
jgi:hypothetical protein